MITTTVLFTKSLGFLIASAYLLKGLYSKIMRPKIFVQIASYRDPECQYTVQDLFEKAKYPKRITVGICWQFDKDKDQECFKIPYKYPKQVRVYEVPAKGSKGVCWARHITQSLWRGEKYTLMIDSHMRFIDYWDEEMISELEKCNDKKALLTCYPAGYTPPNDLQLGTRPVVQRPHFFDKATGNIRFKGDFLDRAPDHPIKGLFIAAGFMFSRGDVIKDVPYDPNMYFSQEEISYVVRLYTSGWNIYHPSKVMIYHYYKKVDQKEIPLHWNDNKEWSQMKERGTARFHYLVRHKNTAPAESLIDIDKYNLGTVRTLEEFEKESGIDFKKLEVSEHGLRAKFIKELPLYKKDPIYIAELDEKKAPPSTLIPQKQEVLLKVGQELPVPVLPPSFKGAEKFVIMLLPVNYQVYLDEFFHHLSSKKDFFKTHKSQKIFIIHDSDEKASELKAKYNPEGNFIGDKEGIIYNAFGRINNSKTHPYTAVIKGNTIMALIDQRNSQNHLGEIMKAIKE